MKTVLCLLIALFVVGSVSAQKERYSEDLSVYRPTVINADSIMSALKNKETVTVEIPTENDNKAVDSCIALLAKKYEGYDFAAGYRIQIYSGTSEQRAKDAKEFARSMDGVDSDAVYLAYRSPNFRVKVGNYLDRLEAYKAYLVLKKQFPSALMVRELKIEASNLRDDH